MEVMCLDIPVKIHSIDKSKNVFVMFDNKKTKVSDAMVKVDKEDYVFLRDTLIIGKTDKKNAEEIINLINVGV